MTATIENKPDDGRMPNGRFGYGNPGGGRRFGSKNAISKKTIAGVQSLADETVAKLADKMREGDMSAIKLILSYCLPAGGRTLDLDGTANPNDLIEAVTTGEVSPDEFARFSQGWKTITDAADIKELKHQVEQLELLITAVTK